MPYQIGLDIAAEEIGRLVKRTGHSTPYGQPVNVRSAQRDIRYQLFGLGSATLGGAGATALSQVFQEVFRPERLTLADSVANNSTVNSIFIGVRPQLSNLASFPASMFINTAVETRVSFDTGQPGQSFQVNVTMAAAGTISGGAFGTVLR